MIKVLKRATLITLAVMGISFVCCLICIPFAVNGAIKDLNRMTSEAIVPTKGITISPNINTIEISSIDYIDVEFKQATGNNAYVEVYSTGYMGRYKSDAEVTESENTAYIGFTREYGTFVFDKAYIEKAFAKSLQNYPDVIIYVPKNMSVKCEDYVARNILSSNIVFANKDELISLLEQKEAEAIAEERQMDIENAINYMEERLSSVESTNMYEIESLRDEIYSLRGEIEELQNGFYNDQ